MLSDGTIRKCLREKRLVITPEPMDRDIQPASIDVRLDKYFARLDHHGFGFIDPVEGTEGHTIKFEAEATYLRPGDFLLGTTIEHVEIPRDMICQVNGKSSLGRMGLQVHATAGFVDPGFKGNITLELSNVATIPILLTMDMRIAQLTFMWLDRPAERPYGTPGLGSKYQNQESVQAAKEQ